jgi:hypothetical protein
MKKHRNIPEEARKMATPGRHEDFYEDQRSYLLSFTLFS